MKYDSSELEKTSIHLYKASAVVWPIFLLCGTLAGISVPAMFSATLGDLTLAFVIVAGVISFFLAYASAVAVVSFLRIHALNGLRTVARDRQGETDWK